MGRRALFTMLVLILGSATARAQPVVRAEGGLVAVTAHAVPLDEVLQSFADETGAEVSFEGPVPRQPVTVDLKGLTPAEAAVEILDGLGIGYALRADPSGTGIEAIYIMDEATGGELAGPATRSHASEPHGPQSELTDADPGLEDRFSEDVSGDDEEDDPVSRARRQPGMRPVGPAAPGSPGGVQPWEDAPGVPEGVEPPGLELGPVTDSSPPPDPPVPSTPTTEPPGMTSSRPEDGAADIEAPFPAPPGSGAGTGKPTVVPPGMKLEGAVPPVPAPGSPE